MGRTALQAATETSQVSVRSLRSHPIDLPLHGSPGCARGRSHPSGRELGRVPHRPGGRGSTAAVPEAGQGLNPHRRCAQGPLEPFGGPNRLRSGLIQGAALQAQPGLSSASSRWTHRCEVLKTLADIQLGLALCLRCLRQSRQFSKRVTSAPVLHGRATMLRFRCAIKPVRM